MKDKIYSYCKKCDNCQSRKPSKLTKAPLGQDPVSEPMEKVTIDVLGPLPVSHRLKRFIVVIMDCYTKWTEAIAMPDQEASTIATAFVNNFVTRFGVPLLLLSDGGTNCDSKLFGEVCKLLQIEKVKTSVMRPQANGVTERFNRTLSTTLTMYCIHDQKDWDLYLPQVMMAYKSSVHSSTGQTPNKMVYGREIILPMAAVIDKPRERILEMLAIMWRISRRNCSKCTSLLEQISRSQQSTGRGTTTSRAQNVCSHPVRRCGCTNPENDPRCVLNSLQDGRDLLLCYKDLMI